MHWSARLIALSCVAHRLAGSVGDAARCQRIASSLSGNSPSRAMSPRLGRCGIALSIIVIRAR
jgi:hypothetical protein